MTKNNDAVAASVPAFAARMGISTSHAWKMIRLGELKVIRLGRATRVPLSELDRLLAQATASAA
jgi:excisionase family DNA binding protein